MRADVDEKQDESVVLFLVEEKQIVANMAFSDALILSFKVVIAIPRFEWDILRKFDYNFIKLFDHKTRVLRNAPQRLFISTRKFYNMHTTPFFIYR